MSFVSIYTGERGNEDESTGNVLLKIVGSPLGKQIYKPGSIGAL